MTKDMEQGAEIAKPPHVKGTGKPGKFVKNPKPGAKGPTEALPKGQKFEPIDLSKDHPQIDSGLHSELWTIIQATPALFAPKFFLEVADDLLKNPNHTSSHLFRAEIFYDSERDPTFNAHATSVDELGSFIKHMKADLKPKVVVGGYPGYTLLRTVVRKLIPRNPKLDNPLVQTCHLFSSSQDAVIKDSTGTETPVKQERYLIIYLPHAPSASQIPWYHPPVRSLAILYTFRPSPGSPLPPPTTSSAPGTLSLHYSLFPSNPLTDRLSRTAINILRVIHKHANGQAVGYTKRVHHDLVVPQKVFQDTYSYLKGKYAEDLIRDWVEQTPATKHVFEDLGIAAFLMECWVNMYGGEKEKGGGEETVKEQDMEPKENHEGSEEEEQQRRARALECFPGFVDVGCGNGLLVSILIQEGWRGWGFDARRRKTWDLFPASVKPHLKAMLLVPEVFTMDQPVTSTSDDLKFSESSPDLSPDFSNSAKPNPSPANSDAEQDPQTHNGIFPTGTFIIANHADELTIWTPCMAFLSRSPFVVIPCCSHNFAGTRFRAPAGVKGVKKGKVDGAGDEKGGRERDSDVGEMETDGSSESKPREVSIPLRTLPTSTTRTQVSSSPIDQESDQPTRTSSTSPSPNPFPSPSPAPSPSPSSSPSSSLSSHNPSDKKPPSSKPGKQVSAYASFCTYLTSLTSTLGYVPEQEILRIPSTRNVAVLGRKRDGTELGSWLRRMERMEIVRRLVEAEMGRDIGMGIGGVGREWMDRSDVLKKPGNGGH